MIKSNTDRFMNKAAPAVIGLAALMLFVLLFIFIVGGNKTNGENNAYIRVINCILSKNATGRQQEDVEKCYVQVEKESGIHLQRYDNLNK